MFRVVFTLVAVLVPGLAVAAPRIAFDRVIPAARDLGGADDIALTYAIGDNEDLETFLAVLLDATNRSGLLRVTDARTAARPPRVDAQMRVTSFTCETTEREGEGNAYDIDGKRIRKPHRFSDAVCTARIEIQRIGGNLQKLSFQVRGEGTSPRVDRVTMEEEGIALDQAARYAALSVADQISPRRIRESIALIEEAPEFSPAISMVESGRLDAARRMWEGAAKRHRQSAAVRHNLAAVCEAAGDIRAAEAHYLEAQKLAPDDVRHRLELEMFRRRNKM